MARRIYAPYHMEPISALASWARHLAVFSLVATIVSVIVVRFGFLDFKPARATFFGARACALTPASSSSSAYSSARRSATSAKS